MEVRNEKDLAIASALVDLRIALEQGKPETWIRTSLAEALGAIDPECRDDQKKIAWVKTLGVTDAAHALLGKYGL